MAKTVMARTVTAKTTTVVEVAALAAVTHPHLVRPLDVLAGTDGASPTLIVEAAPGGDLAARLAAHGPLGVAPAAALLSPVADALAACHAAGVVHGDVSAANVLLGPGGGLLADLGAARGPAVGIDVATATASGTPGSTAPEVLGGAPTDAAADVWALAAVVVAAATGAVVDPGDPTASVARLDPVLVTAVGDALAVTPAARPTAAELAARLAIVATTAGPSEPPRPRLAASAALAPSARRTREFGPRPPGPDLERPGRQRAVAAVLVAGSVLAAIVLGGVLGAGGDEPSATSGPPSPASSGPAGCPPPVAPAGPGVVLTADVDGTGCPTGARWHAGVLVVTDDPSGVAARYALGAPGDIVALGDWDCDGRATPGTYRPATGVVTLYDDWPNGGPGIVPTTVRRAPARGAAEVTTGPDGCDDLLPTPPTT